LNELKPETGDPERQTEREGGGAGDGERGETENGRNGSESLVYEP